MKRLEHGWELKHSAGVAEGLADKAAKRVRAARIDACVYL